jgi:hypothetical protein
MDILKTLVDERESYLNTKMQEIAAQKNRIPCRLHQYVICDATLPHCKLFKCEIKKVSEKKFKISLKVRLMPTPSISLWHAFQEGLSYDGELMTIDGKKITSNIFFQERTSTFECNFPTYIHPKLVKSWYDIPKHALCLLFTEKEKGSVINPQEVLPAGEWTGSSESKTTTDPRELPAADLPSTPLFSLSPSIVTTPSIAEQQKESIPMDVSEEKKEMNIRIDKLSPGMFIVQKWKRQKWVAKVTKIALEKGDIHSTYLQEDAAGKYEIIWQAKEAKRGDTHVYALQPKKKDKWKHYTGECGIQDIIMYTKDLESANFKKNFDAIKLKKGMVTISEPRV